MQNISNLIANGKIEQAIQSLIDLRVDGAVLLMGRYNCNKKNNSMGLINSADYNMERNRM